MQTENKNKDKDKDKIKQNKEDADKTLAKKKKFFLREGSVRYIITD